MTADKYTLVSTEPGKLLDSPTQPRKAYSAAALQELADSIASQGVLQAILVRQRPGAAKGILEVVCGHRRTRAARLAGLAEIPAIVREMTDAEAATAQIHENLQREDVTPLEEAAAFAQLLREHKVPLAQLLKDTGKGKTYIYGRLKLLKLSQAVRDALADGLPIDVAQQISLIPTEALQLQALNDQRQMGERDHNGKAVQVGWLSARAGVEKLANHTYFIPIRVAVFDPEDASLRADRRVCSSCPHLSTNDPASAEAFKEPTCTDTACFDERGQAARDRFIAEHRDAGTLLEGGKAQHAWNTLFHPLSMNTQDGVIRISDKLAHGDAPTIEEIIEQMKAAGDPLPVLKLLHYSNHTQLVLMRSDLPALWHAAGLPNLYAAKATPKPNLEPAWPFNLNAAKATPKPNLEPAWPFNLNAASAPKSTAHDDDDTDDDDDEQPKLKLPLTDEEIVARDAWPQLERAILRAAAARPRTADDLRYIVAYEIECTGDVPHAAVHALGLAEEMQRADADEDIDADEWLLSKLPDLSPDQLALLLLSFAIEYKLDASGPLGERIPMRVAMARTFGVNPLTLDAPPAAPPPTPSPAAQASTKPVARYRNAATRETWSGRGLMPKWLKAAIAGGAKLDDFAIQPGLLAAAGVEAAA
ncbi:MAG: hypothetical protein SHS37scaffold296_28 [Burkholderiales phage 68_11]|nr:MAG: hypothetical protein SHS37scaffold296_28 [Burkholderiales phage 68_11]